MAVYVSPNICAGVEVLWGRDVVWCSVAAVGRLLRKPPGMVTVPGWKFPVVRVRIRGIKWGQRTGVWLVKTWCKILLKSV